MTDAEAVFWYGSGNDKDSNSNTYTTYTGLLLWQHEAAYVQESDGLTQLPLDITVAISQTTFSSAFS